MADRYTSKVGLIVEGVEDVGAVVAAAIRARGVDRAAPVRDEGRVAQEVHWGGRMQKAVVRLVHEDGISLLRTEAYIGSDGMRHGLQRQAQLLQALARELARPVAAVRDVSALTDHDESWLHRVAIGSVELDDALSVKADGQGTWWVRTHGAARFDVPDLELYGLGRHQVDAARSALRHLLGQLLTQGIARPLSMPDGTPVYLVPVLEAWQHLPFAWSGVGRAGEERGQGLDGPRATVSVLHRRRLGRFRRDFDGVLSSLAAVDESAGRP